MNTDHRYTSNIRNLTNLWEAMGARALEPDSGPTLHASEHWPDRLWFGVGTHLERSDALRLVAAGRVAVRPAILPVWSADGPGAPDQRQADNNWSLAGELAAAGFEVGFEQTVMALDLAGWSSEATDGVGVEMQGVERETSDWADVASRSFGYTVPPVITERLIEASGISLLIARKDGQPVGTGLVYEDEATAGIHLVGVVPEARRMGIARQIMMRLLDDARSRGSGLATLQASSKGEGLYRELGFESQGRVSNYRLP